MVPSTEPRVISSLDAAPRSWQHAPMNLILLALFVILGPGRTTEPYREDAPDFVGPLAARPIPSTRALHFHSAVSLHERH